MPITQDRMLNIITAARQMSNIISQSKEWHKRQDESVKEAVRKEMEKAHPDTLVIIELLRQVLNIASNEDERIELLLVPYRENLLREEVHFEGREKINNYKRSYQQRRRTNEGNNNGNHSPRRAREPSAEEYIAQLMKQNNVTGITWVNGNAHFEEELTAESTESLQPPRGTCVDMPRNNPTINPTINPPNNPAPKARGEMQNEGQVETAAMGESLIDSDEPVINQRIESILEADRRALETGEGLPP